MREIFKLFFIVLLALVSVPTAASEIRVDSMAGLSLVATDDESEITPYDLGNPAGLALLSPQTRVELEVPWYSITNSLGGGYVRFYAISPGQPLAFPNLSNSTTIVNATAGSQYQGLVYVDKDGWAFQAQGGLIDTSNVAYIGQGGNGLARAAAQWGPFSFGTEIQYSRMGTTDLMGNSETSNETDLVSNTGILVNIPLEQGPHPVWLRLGGAFSFNIDPLQSNRYEIYNNPMFFSPPYTTENFIQNISTSIWTPCLFLDIPGSFQGGAMANFTNSSGTISSTYNPVQPIYNYGNDNVFNLVALYKCKMGLTDSAESHPLSLNHGLLFEISSFNTTDLNPDGSLAGTNQNTDIRFQFGFGLEREKDFTLGIQTDNYALSQNLTEPPNPQDQLSLFHLSAGLEKWVFTHWALRMGVLFSDDFNGGPPGGVGDFYLNVLRGQKLQCAMITAGIGYEDKVLKVDGVFWSEQPQELYPITGANFYSNIYGAGLSVAVLFGP